MDEKKLERSLRLAEAALAGGAVQTPGDALDFAADCYLGFDSLEKRCRAAEKEPWED